MSIQVSEVFKGLTEQQIPALIGMLQKAQEFAAEKGLSEKDLLETRLVEDMHPLLWQIQTTLEITLRGATRLLEQELASVELKEDTIAGVIERVKGVQAELQQLDYAVIDASVDKIFEIPAGPDVTFSLSGRDYVLKFLLPNIYFHLTTSYALLRKEGVNVGKRDFLGPF